MTLINRPIMEAAKHLATFADERLNQRIIGFAAAVEMDAEQRQRETLGETVSGGNEHLTFVRILSEFKKQLDYMARELEAKSEMLSDLLGRIAVLERDCGELRAAQEPNSLAERLRDLGERPMTALERVEAIRHALTELQALLQAAQRDAFIEATAENARRMLEVAEQVQDEVATLRAEVAALRATIQTNEP